MPTLLFIGLSNITGIQVLVPMGMESVVLRSEIVGAATNLIVNYMRIPRLASTGAAIGTFVAEFTVLLVQIQALHGEIKESFLKVSYWEIVLAVVSSTWIIKLRLGNIITLLISAIIFFGVYGVILHKPSNPYTYKCPEKFDITIIIQLNKLYDFNELYNSYNYHKFFRRL